MMHIPVPHPPGQMTCSVRRHSLPAECPLCGLAAWVLVLVTPEGDDVYECLCGHSETVMSPRAQRRQWWLRLLRRLGLRRES
mgnify:FL=1